MANRHAWHFGLFASELAGSLGLQISLFIIPLAAIKVFDANPIQIATLNVLDSVAALAFGLILGHAVDSFGGALTITIANIARAVACIMVTVSLLWSAHIYYLFAGMFVLGISSLMNDAGVSAAVVQFAGRSPHSLNRLNALLRGSAVVANTGGPGIAGALLLAGGFAAATFVGALSFTLAAGCGLLAWRVGRSRFEILSPSMALATRSQPEPLDPSPSAGGSAPSTLPGSTTFQDAGPAVETSSSMSRDENRKARSILAGLSFIWRHGALRPLTTSSLQFNFFSAIFQAVFLLYCVRTLSLTSTDLAMIGMAAGAGGLLGSILATFRLIGDHARRSYAMSLMVPGGSIALMLVAQLAGTAFSRIFLVAIAEFLFSLSMVVCIVLFNTQRQVESPEGLLGQVAAAERVIALGGELPGAALGGFLGSTVSLEASLMVGAVGMMLSAVWVWTMGPWSNSTVGSD
ncbi:Major Facilitator Superfamily protein [Austwickia chelonae]|uniref:Major facilitator superfamily transporter n=1 Tax=Austwickia chelonae NBRC 105200 TaxID=1184607 RepID=K6VUM7_9MICO|nr:MFS transporter [Austwickia chelonae]GAB79010.1 hypothetical protein AUCHE_18_00110 [Austwickia chelonae NBRC 105200]SEW41630.1 Major Facilitator Superfamily protein [Austwickia chelonae]